MELYELRQRWQQSAPDVSTSFNAQTLDQLLVKADQNPIGWLRRNAWMELGFTLILLTTSITGLFYVEHNKTRTMLIWSIIICLISVGSYHRHMLKGVQGLSEVGATMHAHMTQRIADVRRVMVASYRSVTWVLFITMGINLFFSLYRVLTQYTGRVLLVQIGWMVAGCIIAGLIGYFGVRFIARRGLQELYGRHLDHLESTLRELNA